MFMPSVFLGYLTAGLKMIPENKQLISGGVPAFWL